MRKLLPLLILLAGVYAKATTTLTINVTSLTGGTSPGNSVRIDLQNCAGARVIGTGQIVAQSQTVYPIGGVVTVTLYDNQQIDCGGGRAVSYYSFNYIFQGVITSIGSYNLPPGTFNLSTLNPCVGDACIGGGSTIVNRIIAGTNITISPTTGLGQVTINSTGGGGAGNPSAPFFSCQFNNSGVFGGGPGCTLDILGNIKTKSNDGLKNAFGNQTTPTSNNGIANSLSTANSTVIIGPDYENVEGGYSGGSCAYRVDIGCPPPFANNAILYDYRLPTFGTYAYNTNMGLQGGNWLYDRWISNQQPQTSGAGINIKPYQRDFEVTGSGKNGFDGGAPDSFVGFQWNFEFMRRGIVNPITLQYQAMGVGDGHIWQNVVTNNRGCPDGSCEGFNTVRNQIVQNLTPMTTTANATLAAGATLIAGTLISNVPFPGDGTPYINASKGSGLFHILTSTDPGATGANDAGQLTIDTLTLTPDNIGRVALAVTVPTQYYGATTNATVVVTGLASAITTASTICYADTSYNESARVVSVGGFSSGTQTITVALRYNHQVNAYVVQGSHACTSIDIRANQFPGTFKGRQIIRIIGAIDATHLLYSRIGAGHWLQALSGYAATRIVAAAGVTLTRNGSNVVSAPVTDPFRVLDKDFIIVSGCANTTFNGLFALSSDNGSTVTWPNTGSAGTTTCTNAIEIQSQLNGISVREAQLFPAVEIVNTVDPVTFANNFNLTVEPNTNFQVTAGDQLEDQVYSEVGQGLDHSLLSFRSQVSPSIPDVIHFDQLSDQIPEGTRWTSVAFQDSPINYLGHGGTKPVGNVLLDMTPSQTPFNVIFQNITTPDTAFVSFQGCSFGCADSRSKFDLFQIPAQNGAYTETIHQDTAMKEVFTFNSTQSFDMTLSPALGLEIVSSAPGSNNIFSVLYGETKSNVGGGAGTNSVIDQFSNTILNTVNGTLGVSGHEILTKNSWSVDVPAKVPSVVTGTASNTDLAGKVTLSAGAGTQALTGTYTTAPIVVCSDTTAAAAVKCVATTTSIAFTGTGTDVINYILIGLN